MSEEDRAKSTDSNKADAASKGAAWADSLARLNDRWQAFEAWLCAVVLIVEVSSLTLWISLKGLATDYTPGDNAAGLVTRILLSTVILGTGAHLATRRSAEKVHRYTVLGAVLFGFFVAGKLWAHAGVHWASNVLNALQNASTLMLVGGLRGVATRLTLWLALMGASLATSRGKHIHVDVVIRYVPQKPRAPTAILGWLAAAIMSTVAAVGFVDYIAIAEFRVPAMSPCPDDANKSCDSPAGEKMSKMVHEMGNDLFLVGRQASLDVQTFPRVLAGVPYDKWMKGADWNAWLDGADWSAHFDKAAVDALKMDPMDANATHMPQVVAPGTGEESRGLLIRDANLVFPFGLAVIALKFLLRIVLVISGHIEVHSEEELDDEDLANAAKRDEAAKRDQPAAEATL
jgi:TRAP-type C4-dicarboxylate transport system permease small subunit